jgi:hypothetical protein
MPRIVMFRRRSPRISKGELTKVVIGIVKPSRGSDMKVCHLMGEQSMKDLQGESKKI